MKDLVDPTNNFMTVRRMRTEAYRTEVYTSIIAATNNLRGVALDDEDRRFAVLRNGGSLNNVSGWADRFMEIKRSDPDRLTKALLHIVQEHEVQTSEKDLMTPPKFEGWSDIVAAGDTDLDAAISAVLERGGERMAWRSSDFCEEVRLEMFGDRKARRGDGVRGAVTDLVGARAERFGAWHMPNTKYRDRGTVGSLIVTDPVWFTDLSLKKRAEALGEDPHSARRDKLKLVPKDDDDGD
jgi:hypothetical protein